APPAAGPEKSVPILGVRKALRKTLFARIGVLPNGPGRWVVFGKEFLLLTAVQSAVADAGMKIGRTHSELGEFWLLVVTTDQPDALQVLDDIVWREWLAMNAEEQEGVHPDKTLVRAATYWSVGEAWPPQKK